MVVLLPQSCSTPVAISCRPTRTEGPQRRLQNSLAPGDTRTGRYLGTRHVDEARLVTEGTLDRVAQVDEVARVVDFFAGPLGAFVTGQVLRVDGGTQCWPS